MDFISFFKKKSQITIFLIIGLILLFIIFFLVLIFSKDTPNVTPSQKSDDFVIFVEECLFTTLQEAVVKIGEGGGFIDYHLAHGFNPVDNPLESNSLNLFNSLELVYWFDQDKSGLNHLNIPPLYKTSDDDSSIQSQIENYVNENIENCFNGFKTFSDRQIEVIEKSPIKTEVLFTDSKVIGKLDYSVDIIMQDGTVTNYRDYTADVLVNLKKIYEYAKEITLYQSENAFIENVVLDLISIYSRVDKDYLPPMYHFDMDSCSDYVFWSKTDVEDKFREVLASNIPFITLVNGEYFDYKIDESEFEDEELEIAKGVMEKFKHQVSENDYSSILTHLSFMEQFPLYFDLGVNFLEPRNLEVDLIFSKYCFFEYRTYYSSAFPVLFTLYDQDSIIDDKKGYLFQFPILSVIRNNFPRVDYMTNDESPIEDVVSYQCNLKQRISDNVTIKVTDRLNKPIDDVLVLFRCGPNFVYDYDGDGNINGSKRFAENCIIGKTNSSGILFEKFPPCIGGGVIELKRDGYSDYIELVGDIREDEEYSFDFNLLELVDLNVSLNKFIVNDDVLDIEGKNLGCLPNFTPMPIENNEHAMIRIEMIESQDGHEISSSPYIYYTTQNESTISLVPGIYEAEVMLMRNEKYPGEMMIKRNSQSKTIDKGIVDGKETIYYPDEDIELPMVMSGGSNFTFEVKSIDLYNSNEIKFYTFDFGIPKYVEKIGTASNEAEICSNTHDNLLTAEFS